jgi:hypothetical protein
MIVDDRRAPEQVNEAEPTETSPLLREPDEAQGNQPLSRSRIMRFQRAHLALPVVFLGFMCELSVVQTY